MEVEFIVEGAGCPSCAKLVGNVVAELGALREVSIDEKADVAHVRAEIPDTVGSKQLDAALGGASGVGHAYRVRPGSWQPNG